MRCMSASASVAQSTRLVPALRHAHQNAIGGGVKHGLDRFGCRQHAVYVTPQAASCDNLSRRILDEDCLIGKACLERRAFGWRYDSRQSKACSVCPQFLPTTNAPPCRVRQNRQQQQRTFSIHRLLFRAKASIAPHKRFRVSLVHKIQLSGFLAVEHHFSSNIGAAFLVCRRRRIIIREFLQLAFQLT